MRVHTEVLESPIVRLHTGKFVDTYATLYRTEGSAMVSLVYNGFEGTAVSFASSSDVGIVESLIELASRDLVEQVRDLMLSGGRHV